MENDNVILEVKNLKQWFPIHAGFFQRVVGHVKAVDGVNFAVHENEVMGLVGESGCGKTTVGRTLLRLYEPTDGEIWFRKEDGTRVDVAKVNRQEMKALRREMRMIFQDPFSSLNPRFYRERHHRRTADDSQGCQRSRPGQSCCQADAGSGP